MANEYISLAELKNARRIDAANTDQDAALERAIRRASRAIDNRCGRHFYSEGVPTARTIALRGAVVSASPGASLLVDDIASADGLLVGSFTDYTASPTLRNGQPWPITSLYRAAGWHGTSLTITADWGWPEVPDPIQEATLLLANRRYMRQDSPEGVANWSQEGPVRVSRFDPDIEDLVGPYVLDGFGA